MKRVVVHIDELVLRGFHHEDRLAVAEGLRAELARHFAEPGAARDFAARGNLPRLEAGAIRIAPGARPSTVGTEAAQRIVRGSKP
jgi:hypothetical protein